MKRKKQKKQTRKNGSKEKQRPLDKRGFGSEVPRTTFADLPGMKRILDR
ncbi:MAG: hypothetical protein GF349_03990 [Candidatus Magasanikbacteria bacterium]|nr:hypothetical protein [Candidatus Magasanikbacteria bacterium]